MLVWGLGGRPQRFLHGLRDHARAVPASPRESARVGLRPGHAAQRAPAARCRWHEGLAWLDGTPRPLPIGEPGPWLELGAGAALAAAVAIKASAAIVVPVMIFGAPRRMRFALGLLIGLLVFGAATVFAFGFNLPNIAQQDVLVVQAGVPNVLGYILGAGGESAHLHTLLSEGLVIGVVGCTLWTARTRRWITASGVAILLLLLTLSWMLPSYMLWLLPFAALARRRWLRVTSVVFGIYIFLFWMPYAVRRGEASRSRHLASTALAQQLAT